MTAFRVLHYSVGYEVPEECPKTKRPYKDQNPVRQDYYMYIFEIATGRGPHKLYRSIGN